MSWVSYSENKKAKRRKHDFKVRYRFYSEQEGGRKSGPPFQGYRSDFLYEDDDPGDSIYMIWPEFEDETGDVIGDDQLPVPTAGIARMWIISENMRSYHQGRIKIGTKGFMVEGPKKVGECEVVSADGLTDV